MKALKTLAAVLVAGAGLLGTSQALAVPTFSDTDYSCDGGAACNGLLFSIKIEAIDSNSWYIGYSIKVTSSYTGSSSDVLKAVQVKNFGTDISNRKLEQAPVFIDSWVTNDGELSAQKICETGGGTDDKNICTYWNGEGHGVGPMTVGATFTFVWSFDATSVVDSAEIKFLCKDVSDKKACGMGSFTQGGDGTDGNVPEPGTLALLGLGLLGLGFGARRKRV